MPPLTCQEFAASGLANEMAAVVGSNGSAKMILIGLGLSPGQLPNASNPLGFWIEVCQLLYGGAITGEYRLERLLGAAYGVFPGNTRFATFSAFAPGRYNQGNTVSTGSVFLCYSSADRGDVDRLYEAIKAGKPDLDIFQDHRSIHPGKDWQQVIRENASAATLMLCWFTDNFQHADYVKYEIGMASGQGAKVVPLLIPPAAPGALPPYLQHLQGIHATRPLDFSDLAEKILLLL